MSSRKHRRPANQDTNPDPESDEGKNIGQAEHPLPGGQNHLINQPVARGQEFPKVVAPYYSGMMAHGVATIPPDQGGKVYPEGGRIAPNSEERHKIEATKSAPIPEKAEELPPVLVKVVSDAAPGHALLTLYTNRVPVGQIDAVPLCVRDDKRTNVYLLNEDPANDIRFSTEFTQVSVGNGSILPHAGTGYLRLKCQERIYALAVAGTLPVYVSVIMETVIDEAIP